MPALISVAPSLTTVSGIDHLRITDLYYDAPDPPDGPVVDGLRTCGANLLFLHERLPDAVWHDPGNRLMEARAYRYMARLRTAEPGEYERNFPFKTTPLPYQLRVFTYARHMPNFALSPAVLGSGKTKMTLDVAADKFLRNEIDGMAIIAPNTVHAQWVNEAMPEHLSNAVMQRRWYVHKSGKSLPDRMLRPRGREFRIAAWNVEAFSRRGSQAEQDLIEYLASGRVLLVMDESTRIKNYKAERTKTILRIAQGAACRAFLTGTPITKGLEDFFTQYQFLDPNIIGLRNWFAFRGRYCVTAPVPGRAGALGALRITGYRNQEELIRRIAPVSFMIPESELGLPEKRYERRIIELTPEQRQVYDMLSRQLIEDLHANRVENPAYAIVRMLRLQQVLCGRYYELTTDDDGIEGKTPRLLPNNRPRILAEMLEDMDGQALIWCRFRPDIDDIVEAISGLGRVGIIEGEVAPTERRRQIEVFQRGELDYMILNMSTGSTGLDGLQCCSTSIYYSNTFNREHRWQSEGRIHRLGQRHSTLFVDFVVPRSIDTMILRAFRETADLARSVMANPNMVNGGVDDELERLEAGTSGDAGSRAESLF